MKRVITAIVLLVGITVAGIVWSSTANRHFRPLQALAAEAEQCYLAGDTDGALQKSEQLSEEYKRQTWYFDLFIPHQSLLEAEKSVDSLALILRYGEPKDFVVETHRCQLLLKRLWEQELPKLSNIL